MALDYSAMARRKSFALASMRELAAIIFKCSHQVVAPKFLEGHQALSPCQSELQYYECYIPPPLTKKVLWRVQ